MDNTIKLYDNVPILGEITANFWYQSDEKIRKMNIFLSNLAKRFPSHRKEILKYHKKGVLISQDKHKNVIASAGLGRVAGTLVGDITTLPEIDKAVFGTGSGTPSVNDTSLFTEAHRNDIFSGTYDKGVAYLTAILTETEYVGTITEFGNLINNQYLWSHIAGFSWVKTGTVSMTIDCQYTFYSV